MLRIPKASLREKSCTSQQYVEFLFSNESMGFLEEEIGLRPIGPDGKPTKSVLNFDLPDLQPKKIQHSDPKRIVLSEYAYAFVMYTELCYVISINGEEMEHTNFLPGSRKAYYPGGKIEKFKHFKSRTDMGNIPCNLRSGKYDRIIISRFGEAYPCGKYDFVLP